MTPMQVLNIVSKFYGRSADEILSPSHYRGACEVRQVVMYMLNVRRKMTFQSVAVFLNRSNHTTIMHGVNSVKRKMNIEAYRKQIELLEQEIPAYDELLLMCE